MWANILGRTTKLEHASCLYYFPTEKERLYENVTADRMKRNHRPGRSTNGLVFATSRTER
jgi:hypothetical protein